MKNTNLIYTVLAVFLVLQGIAAAAILPISENDVIQYKISTGYVSPRVGGIDIMVNGTEVGYVTPGMEGDAIWAGAYLADIRNSLGQDIATSYKTFCMNVLLDPPFDNYAPATAVAASSDFEWMWGTYYDEVITDPVKAAAFQLAFWEVVHETSGTYDIENGNFYLLGLNTGSPNNNGATWASIVGYAATYLDSSTWTNQAELVTLEANGMQPFIVEVPEPATLALLGIGGLLLRRKK